MPIVFHSLVKKNMNLEIVIMAGIQPADYDLISH